MVTLFLQLAHFVADVIVFFFAGYYLFSFMQKEKQLEEKEMELKKKEGKIDSQYHQIVDDALTKERKILEDAANEAEGIVSKTKLATKSFEETVNKALQEIVDNVQKEATSIASNFITDYQTSIKQFADKSLGDLQNVTKEMSADMQKQQKVMTDIQQEAINNTKQVAEKSLINFQNVTHELESSLQKQIKDFHDSALPSLQKEVEEYKQERLKEVDKSINLIIQKVSQKALNKTIPLEDHKNLIIESLEKAKKEGIFD